jgi:hypothetical protein
MDGVTTTHSGRVTPAAAASSDESIDNCEFGAEAPGDEMDTTTTTTTAATEDAVVGGSDADAATDSLATRYANLDSPADRYVCFPFSPLFTILRDDRAIRLLFVIPSLTSLSRHIARHLSLSLPLFPSRASQSPFGWECLILFPTLYILPPIYALSRFFGGGWTEQRLDFTRNSIVYLFRTTYTSDDSLTIAALVAYMNAALPPDKHEEFDTAEVTRAAKMLQDRGRVAFEGDMLKPLH